MEHSASGWCNGWPQGCNEKLPKCSALLSVYCSEKTPTTLCANNHLACVSALDTAVVAGVVDAAAVCCSSLTWLSKVLNALARPRCVCRLMCF